MSVQAVLPRIMEIGADSILKLPDILTALGCSRPLIITDKMMTKLGYSEQIVGLLATQKIPAEIFDDTIPEPTEGSIQAGIAKVRDGNFDSVIALGGGSPIDSAKAIAVLGKHGGKIREYRAPRQVTEAGLPLIAIPTTAGTGSEVTRFTIITDETNDEKLLCVGIAFVPAAAIVDYKLTMSVPARTTADTGIDAMTHAMEAYVSKKASPYADSQAIAALRLIGPNLRRVYENGKDEEAREAMMLGATLAGVAFSTSSVALVHGMSRPIGAFFHVPHGLSNAMLLPTVTKFSLSAAPKRYADCARALGTAEISDSDEVAGDKLIAFLEALNRDFEVPTLAKFGADKALFDRSIQTMAEQALASGSPGNNPRVPTAAEIVDLYKALWS